MESTEWAVRFVSTGGAGEYSKGPVTTNRRTPVQMTQTWRSTAACAGIDPEIFYPATEDDRDAVAAKAVCAECGVREACLEHALLVREKDGIWGGATERERRRIIRQRRRTA